MKQLAIISSLNILSEILHQHHDSACEAGTFTGATQHSTERSSRLLLLRANYHCTNGKTQDLGRAVLISLFYLNLLKEKGKREKREEKYQSSLSKKAS